MIRDTVPVAGVPGVGVVQNRALTPAHVGQGARDACRNAKHRVPGVSVVCSPSARASSARSVSCVVMRVAINIGNQVLLLITRNDRQFLLVFELITLRAWFVGLT
jgi:hypothetical protein